MYPELPTQIWMSTKKNASMIIGMLMGQETCRILFTGFKQITHLDEMLLTDICGPGGD